MKKFRATAIINAVDPTTAASPLLSVPRPARSASAADCNTARSPEEFEQQIEASGSAESRSATMVFFENTESNGKISKRLLGKGTQMPSPSPDPFSC
jgi:hypothetical protein